MTCASLLVVHLTGLCTGSTAPPLYDPPGGGAEGGELLTLHRETLNRLQLRPAPLRTA